MSSKLKVYSAREVSLIVGGLEIDSGFAEGEFISIEPQAEDFTDKAGPDGEVARSAVGDFRATIKIKLLHTSEGNNILTALRDLDLVSNGSGIGAFMLRDRSAGAIIAQADKVWVQKPPTVSRGREIAETEWTLRAAAMKLNVVGNPAV